MIIDPGEIERQIFAVAPECFEELALKVFNYQRIYIHPFKKYLEILGISNDATSLKDIRFMPINFFKTHTVLADDYSSEMTFTSSSTGGKGQSHHELAKLELYKQSFLNCFKKFYGNPSDWCIMALLPSYLEREGSSLVYMMNELIKESGKQDSGFYLYDHSKLYASIMKQEAGQQKTILLGVSFALMDFAEKYTINLKHTHIIETGGMKGRAIEPSRAEMHAFLCKQFGVKEIHSEYGMTELLSQAYSKGQGLFQTPPWMRVSIRDIADPLSLVEPGQWGAINIIDLANIYSCSFIATDDIGRINMESNTFEMSGRMDYTDLRGCSLLYI